MHEPATFHRALNISILRNGWKSCLINFADIFIFSKDVHSEVRGAMSTMTVLNEARLSPKLPNWKLFRQEFEYLEHITKLGKILTDFKKSSNGGTHFSYTENKASTLYAYGGCLSDIPKRLCKDWRSSYKAFTKLNCRQFPFVITSSSQLLKL